MKNKTLTATKNILEKNMKVLEFPFCSKKLVLIYDSNSKLSKLIGEAYSENIL
jgi:hypothetical protein